MKDFSFTISDPNGIHARPAGLFAQKMQGFKSDVSMTKEDQSADCKKIFAMMKLRPKCGQTILIKAEGEDEEAAIAAAEEFLKANL
jgi:phosphotransferase system HPr (HPr) family protein